MARTLYQKQRDWFVGGFAGYQWRFSNSEVVASGQNIMIFLCICAPLKRSVFLSSVKDYFLTWIFDYRCRTARPVAESQVSPVPISISFSLELRLFSRPSHFPWMFSNSATISENRVLWKKIKNCFLCHSRFIFCFETTRLFSSNLSIGSPILVRRFSAKGISNITLIYLKVIFLLGSILEICESSLAWKSVKQFWVWPQPDRWIR